MFSIYGETGRVFRGPMEDLWRIEAVRRAAHTRAVSPQATFRLPVSERQSRGDQPAGNAPPVSPQARDAVAAYVQGGPSAAQRHPLTRVQDVMSQNILSIPADATVMQGWQQLAEHGMGQAPVIDAHGLLVGLLSRADLLRPDRLPAPDSSPLAWRALLAQSVASVMWTPVPAVDPQTDLRRVARVLLDTHLPGLPVVNADDVVTGFISRTDILRAVVHDPPLDLWS